MTRIGWASGIGRYLIWGAFALFGLTASARAQSTASLPTCLVDYGYWVPAAVIGLLGAWHAVRGRILIEGGWSGRTLHRYGGLERATHWILAVSFLCLAITGFAGLYLERIVVTPPPASVATIHKRASPLFLAALLICFLRSARHLSPSRYDSAWVRRGGMLFGRHRQPPAGRYTATQKVMFLLLLIAGGLAASTGYGVFDLPSLSRGTLHAATGIVITSVVVAHVYFRTIGIQGAFDAVWTGDVDVNWAKQHHAVWAEDELWRAADREESAAGGQSDTSIQPSMLRP